MTWEIAASPGIHTNDGTRGRSTSHLWVAGAPFGPPCPRVSCPFLPKRSACLGAAIRAADCRAPGRGSQLTCPPAASKSSPPAPAPASLRRRSSTRSTS
eukprot:scaffold30720_cov48-Phaeocystis_antarctica.AAC.1